MVLREATVSDYGTIVGGEIYEIPGVPVRRWGAWPDVERLPARPRGDRRPTQIVVHESVTTSRARTEAVLQRRGLGVHYMIDAVPHPVHGGYVTQHGDPLLDRMSHAGSQNGTSFAIEVINPYYPKHLRDGDPWVDTIDAPWAHRGRYVVPTPAQLEAAVEIIAWATDPIGPMAIPLVWPGVREGRMALSRVPGAEPRSPGIWAHCYTAHADGGFPALYAWLRLEAGMGAGEARAEAIRLASGAGRWATLPAEA